MSCKASCERSAPRRPGLCGGAVIGLALLALVALVPAPAEAGPWGRERGRFYVKGSYARLQTQDLATPLGDRVEIPEFTLERFGVYAELGLGRRWMALVDVPLWHRSELDAFGSASGPGDLRLGLQYELHARDAWVMAVRGIVQAPTGDESKGEGLLPTGSGALEGEALFSLGCSLGDGRGYAFAELGHQFRGEKLRDALVYAGQVGAHFGPRLDLALELRGVAPWKDASQAFPGSAAGLGDGVKYTNVGLVGSFKLGAGLALDAGVDRSFQARNLAVGTTLRIGISLTR